ncbi:diguanylate cyclase (GGDEF) domain-containing protein [Sphaerochaeta pleomorpha str. Grapes]|uniref:Diguanylate cyclase (GGDEF) domain-containing protein n=1 Tax=Sphaerochaeta pleomorpha (strain ATCC BAA-1885 / DSM 22778 / Grapes) TaxID=158190 RepID=G8QVK1_SPHPG|nr:diguanylate cyclase [Sphaerochaeta pleomorpha]AEV28234.1 diguanylate cyclase (GGDEF) domain-containing protein [Sphaerochaeta pleomorpha str. Grapes]
MDISGPVSIAEGLWWVGDDLCSAELHCNPYLLLDKGSAVLFDPGSVLDVEIVMAKVKMLIPLEKLEAIVVSHQDPDLCSAIPMLEQNGFSGCICCHERAATIIQFYGVKSPFYYVDQNNFRYQMKNGNDLRFLYAPYLHFPAAIMTYLQRQKAVITGDLFGAIANNWYLYASEDYHESMKTFHEIYMPSHEILEPVMNQLLKLDIHLICPQHGSIIVNDCKKYIEILKNLECGFFLKPLRKNLMEAGGYPQLCNQVIKRYFSIYGVKKVRETFEGSGFVLDYQKKTIESSPFSDNSIWEEFFDLVFSKKGMPWITIIFPLVEKMTKEYSIPLPKPFKSLMFTFQQNVDLMTEKNQELEKKRLALQDSLQDAQNRCPITGLHNQMFFNRFFSSEMKKFNYEETTFGLVLLSIDNLSNINLDFGRIEGDDALKTLTYYLKEAFPGKDEYHFKLQGGVFALYLPGTKRKEILERTDRLCATVSDSEAFIVPSTISIGLFHTDRIENTKRFSNEELEEVALQTALYRLKLAKRQGGNKVVADSSKVWNANSSIRIVLAANPGIEKKLIEEALKREGYILFLASNGLEARTLIEKENPDIIISELMTSKLSAFTLRKELMKKSAYSDIPFILFSSNKNENTVSRSIGLGISHFFACPVMLIELIGVVGLYASSLLQQEA